MNFWKVAVLALGMLVSVQVVAQQQEAKYFDEKGKRVSKEKATYYTREELINSQPPVVKSTGYYADSDAIYAENYFAAEAYNSGKKVKVGEQKVWNKSGQLIRKENYKEGLLQDSLISYYDSGKLRRIEIYKADKMVKGTVFAEDGSKLRYQPSDQMPSFPGGEKAMFDFIAKTLKYPKEAAKENITGTVIMAFVVGEDGVLRDIKVDKGIRPDLDAESIRVIEAMPAWQPGVQNDKKVPVKYRLPIKFGAR